MKQQRTEQEKLHLLVLTGLFAGLICLFTAYICHIPMGSNGGYLHFGDTLIYVAASLLPQPYALVAAAIGGGLADLRIAPFLSWIISTIGYYLAEGLIFGTYAALVTSIMGSAIQSGGSLLFYYLVAGVLDRQDVKARLFHGERMMNDHGSDSLYL